MKRKLMLLLTCLFVGIGLVTAQITKVTGTVISEEDGLPVVGASILVKGTTVGTVLQGWHFRYTFLLLCLWYDPLSIWWRLVLLRRPEDLG